MPGTPKERFTCVSMIVVKAKRKRSFVDGPFAETKELIAGYTLIQVKSRDEAIDWARRFPNPGNEDGEIEVRQVFELDDFQPNEAIERFREIVGRRS